MSLAEQSGEIGTGVSSADRGMEMEIGFVCTNGGDVILLMKANECQGMLMSAYES